MGQNQSKELSGHVLGVFEREGITNVPTFSAAYAAKYGFYPLFQMRLDYMVDMDLRDYTRQWSLDKFEEQIELFISPPEFRPIESEEDNILLSMFIDDYGSRQCTQQGIKNTLDALSSFVSVSPNNNRSCFGHSLPGAYTRKNRKIKEQEFVFTSQELSNFNNFVQIDVFKNLSNLTLTGRKRRKGSKKQYVYDKKYALSMVNYFKTNSSNPEAICYIGWVVYRGLVSSIPVKNTTCNKTAVSAFTFRNSSTSDASGSKYANDNADDVATRISFCWARSKEVIFGAKSPFAAGFNILSNARYQGIESMLFTSDMKTIAFAIFQIVTKLLENRNQDAAFVKFLGFEVLGQKDFHQVNIRFTSEVQSLIKASFKDIYSIVRENGSLKNENMSLSEIVMMVRRVYQLGISIWINTPSLQIHRIDTFGGHSVNRLILEPFPYFDFYLKWNNRTNNVDTSEKFNWPGSRAYNASYSCGPHVMYYPMHFIYVPRYASSDTLWAVDASTYGQSITNTLYDILMDPTVAEFHGFKSVDLDKVYLNDCLGRIESKLKAVTAKYNLTYDPRNFKRLLFGYLVLSEFTKIPEYNIGGLIKIIELENLTISQLFHISWFQEFCEPVPGADKNLKNEAELYESFTTVNINYKKDFQDNCTYLRNWNVNKMCII